MQPTNELPFCDWIRELVRRICDRDGVTRQEVADRLGVHLHSISAAAYRAAIGCELALKLAEMAEASPEERHSIELAWLEAKCAVRRDDALLRAVRLMNDSLEERRLILHWISEQSLLAKYCEWRGNCRPTERPEREQGCGGPSGGMP